MAVSQNPEELFQQLFAVSSSKPYLKIIILTNASVKGGFVDRFINDREWQGAREEFKIITTTILDAYPDGLPPKIESIRRSIPYYQWEREYLCVAASGEDTLNNDLVKKAINKDLFDIKGYKVLTLDLGLTRNPTGLTVIETGGGKINVLTQEYLFKTPIETIVERTVELFKAHGCNRVIVDKGVSGLALYQLLVRRLGEGMVDGVNVNNSSRQKDFKILERAIEEETISFGGNDLMLDDLMSISLDKIELLYFQKESGKIIGFTAIWLIVYYWE